MPMSPVPSHCTDALSRGGEGSLSVTFAQLTLPASSPPHPGDITGALHRPPIVLPGLTLRRSAGASGVLFSREPLGGDGVEKCVLGSSLWALTPELPGLSVLQSKSYTLTLISLGRLCSKAPLPPPHAFPQPQPCSPGSWAHCSCPELPLSDFVGGLTSVRASPAPEPSVAAHCPRLMAEHIPPTIWHLLPSPATLLLP